MKLSEIGYSKTVNEFITNKFITYKTPTPSFSNLPLNVNENSYFTGSFIVEPNTTYKVWCDKGTISSVDFSNGTFIYKAFDIVDNTDSSDTLYIQANKSGYLISDINSVTINVIYVPMVADDALINNDLKANMLQDVNTVGFNFI